MKVFRSRTSAGAVLLAMLLSLGVAGCKKKVPPPPPPPPPPAAKTEPPPPPARPEIGEFTAEPSTIDRGQSATLRFSVQDATDVFIDQGVGQVQATGTARVTPNTTTTYTLTAKGPGGSTTRTATVNVNIPPPAPPPTPKAPAESAFDRIARTVQDAYFDYDRADLREDARNTLTRNADALKSALNDFQNLTIIIEGHADERGSAEYNLGLADRRASAAKDFLVQLGVPADRLRTISYGKERQQCTEQTEDCWQRNRRAHFAVAQ